MGATATRHGRTCAGKPVRGCSTGRNNVAAWPAPTCCTPDTVTPGTVIPDAVIPAKAGIQCL
jgi:hypothetical protein